MVTSKEGDENDKPEDNCEKKDFGKNGSGNKGGWKKKGSDDEGEDQDD